MSRFRTRTLSRIVEALSSREFLRRSGFFTGLNLGIGALVGGVIVSFIVVTEWLADIVVHGPALGAVRFAAPVLGAHGKRVSGPSGLRAYSPSLRSEGREHPAREPGKYRSAGRRRPPGPVCHVGVPRQFDPLESSPG